MGLASPLNFLDDAVAPGVTNTAMSAPRQDRGSTDAGLAEADDIADVVVFLATDAGRFVVGQLIHVNGGDYHG